MRPSRSRRSRNRRTRRRGGAGDKPLFSFSAAQPNPNLPLNPMHPPANPVLPYVNPNLPVNPPELTLAHSGKTLNPHLKYVNQYVHPQNPNKPMGGKRRARCTRRH